VPAAQVEFDNGDKSLDGVFDLGDWKKHLGVAHEAIGKLLASPPSPDSASARSAECLAAHTWLFVLAYFGVPG
jgi:hypothetical protein